MQLAKKKSGLELATSKVLEKQGKTESQWKKETLEKAQFKFFRGEDKDLEEYVLNRAREELIVKEINKRA